MSDPASTIIWFLLEQVTKQSVRTATSAVIRRVSRGSVDRELAAVFRGWREDYGKSHAAATVMLDHVAGLTAQVAAEMKAGEVPVTGDRFVWYEAIRAAWLDAAGTDRATDAYYEQVHSPHMDLANRLAATCRRVMLDLDGHHALPTRDYVDEAPAAPTLVGRSDELAALAGFTMSDRAFAWWLVRGEPGVGKSRLAYEVMAGLPPDWHHGFIDGSIAFDWSAWVPTHRTFLVLDGAERDPDAAVALVAAVARACRASGIPTRLLLLDQAPSVVWARLASPFTDAAKDLRRTCHEDEPLDLAPLSASDAGSLHLAIHGAPAVTDDARAVVAAGLPRWIRAGGGVGSLLSSHLALAMERARKVPGYTKQTLDLLALSSICGPLPLFGPAHEAALRDLLGRDGYEPDAMAALTGREARQAVPAMSPQFLGDHFVIDHLDGPRGVTTRTTIIEHAWRLGPDEMLDFVSRNAAALEPYETWRALLARSPVPPPVQWIGAIEVATTTWVLGGSIRNATALLRDSLPLALTSPRLLTHWLHGLNELIRRSDGNDEIARWLDRCWTVACEELPLTELAEAIALGIAIESVRSPGRRVELVGRLRAIAAHRHPDATKLFMVALQWVAKDDHTHAGAAAEFLEVFAGLSVASRRALAQERVRVAYEEMRRATDAAAVLSRYQAMRRDILGDDRQVEVEQLRCSDDERGWVVDHVAMLAALACQRVGCEPAAGLGLAVGHDLAALARLAGSVAVEVRAEWLAAAAQLVLASEPSSDESTEAGDLRRALVDAFAPHAVASRQIASLLEDLGRRGISDPGA